MAKIKKIELLPVPKWKRELRQEGWQMKVILKLNEVIEYINADNVKRETRTNVGATTKPK